MISCANQIVTYDLNSILSVMVACTATFVAIIGGLIANKAITDRAEKESIDRQLSQIDLEIKIANQRINSLKEKLVISYTYDFIDEHINELLAEKNLSKIYDNANNENILEEELLPYWRRAIEAVRKFKANINGERNKDGVPKVIVEELDSFQYNICSTHSKVIERRKKFLYETMTTHPIEQLEDCIKIYHKRPEGLEEEITKKEQLEMKKKLLVDRKQDVTMSNPVKNGVRIFVLVSLLCIVMPLIFMLFNPTTNCVWYAIEIVLSFVSFIIGILVMIIYICSLFPKKNDDVIDKDE